MNFSLARSSYIMLALVLLALSNALRADEPICPVSLSNPDGQAMELEKYDLRVAVHGALSLSEMEMVFRNPAPRQMEGRFLYLLPPGATISRFAKEVNGKLMEGEVVERLRAQSIYTEILQTMRDPALLEMDQGNRFSARVFPIPANGTVRLLLSYSQLLSLRNNERKLTIPMAGMPKIKEFSFSATGRKLPGEIATRRIAGNVEKIDDDGLSGTLQKAKDFTPVNDIELTFKAADDAPDLRAFKSGNFQMLSVRPEVPAAVAEKPADWVFYFDTSASNADNEARRIQSIESLLFGLVPVLRKTDSTFEALAFDFGVVNLFPATSMNSKGGSPIMPQVVNSLRARHAVGATNLEAVLKHIGEQARAKKAPCRFVLVSDGIATLGSREVRDLLAALGDWPEGAAMHALVIGNKMDDKTLNAIVGKTRGRVVTLQQNVKDAAAITEVLAQLQAPVGEAYEFYDEGAAWIYPKSFRDVRPGSELIVFSELKDGARAKPGMIRRGANGKVASDRQLDIVPVDLPGFEPLLQRESYRAFLDHLEQLEQHEENAAKRDEFHQKRIAISTKNRVLCPLTSLLVLETENDYARFGIDRTALAGIMAVGKNGIEMKQRGAEDLPPPAPPRASSKLAAKKSLSLGEANLFDGDSKDEAKSAAVELRADRNLGGGSVELGAELKEALADASRSGDAAAPETRAAAHPSPFALPPDTDATLARTPTGARSRTVNAAAASAPAANAFAAAPETTVAAPDWMGQARLVPTEQQLSELRAKVAGNPRDRALRNAYADALLKARQWDTLQGQVFEWLPFDPENPQVFEFLGQSATNLKDPEMALRAFTSIAEIAPNRAALLARAGWLLIAANKFPMAEQMFREALKNRADDCNIYRGLSLSLLLNGKYDDAAKVLEEALGKEFNPRYGDVKRVMREELGYAMRLWSNKIPGEADAVKARAAKDNVNLAAMDALRVTLCWETDANDVDLHVIDPNKEECFYSHMRNASGLELYSDQTQGLGPEVIRCEKALPGTYHIGVNYFSAGAMGASRGVAVIMRPEQGVAEHPVVVPFCLMPDGPPIRYLDGVKY